MPSLLVSWIVMSILVWNALGAERIQGSDFLEANVVGPKAESTAQTAYNKYTTSGYDYDPHAHTSPPALTLGSTIMRLLETVSSTVSLLSHTTEALVRKVTQHFEIALHDLQNELANTVDAAFIQNSINKVLQNLLEFEHMTQFIDDTFDGLVGHFNETLINNTETMERLAANMKNHLRGVNETKFYKGICQEVDTFIEKGIDQLKVCCDVTIKPVRSLCRNARDLLASALRIFVDAVDRIQVCVEDKQSYVEFMTPCLNVVYEDVSNLIKRAIALHEKVQMIVPARVMYSRRCISVVLVEMEQTQKKLESDYYSRLNKHF